MLFLKRIKKLARASTRKATAEIKLFDMQRAINQYVVEALVALIAGERERATLIINKRRKLINNSKRIQRVLYNVK